MPADDVSDLRDVVDAINKLCETMKSSSYEESEADDYFPVESRYSEPVEIQFVNPVESIRYEPVDSRGDRPAESPPCSVPRYEECSAELVSPEEVSVRKVEAYRAERWRDSQEDAETVTSDTEPAIAQFEPISEMYYTASSEVSLLSDLDLPERAQNDEDNLPESREKDERKECVIAGHVAAMRERFESMTRTNTPCPDMMRSMSPSLDVFRNITPSPDRLG
ncbi:uncharacterized protein LOC128202227 [Galleria mellonella]|uniref:Uncharacterized protein LOC128202227 n=1 Tax=Galleria mellonella TaxID=7137 RepID=A0ABM3N2C5_GALME|nr:uncharacterized protein LOC128202227 [Galleria mellonella]